MPNKAYIRTSADADISEIKDYITLCVNESDPSFNYDIYISSFDDDELGSLYSAEKQITTLISIFTLVSIIISLMGVYGLVLFETQFRQREIAIRRTQGASIMDILWLINRKFIIIIITCFVISAPIAYFIIQKWLEGFAAHISINYWVFALVLAIITILVTTIVTIRSYRAANCNPAELIGKNQ